MSATQPGVAFLQAFQSLVGQGAASGAGFSGTGSYADKWKTNRAASPMARQGQHSPSRFSSEFPLTLPGQRAALALLVRRWIQSDDGPLLRPILLPKCTSYFVVSRLGQVGDARFVYRVLFVAHDPGGVACVFLSTEP